jgi:hypothetical protein
MSDFVQKVQSGDISQPTQNSFSLERWQQSFESISHPSDVEVNLYETGKWIFNKLERIRRKLAPLMLADIPRDELARIFVGIANRDCHLAGSALPPIDESKTYLAEQLLRGQLKGNLLGPPARPDEIIMSSVDGSRFPLIFALKSPKKPGSKLTLPDGETLDRAKGMMVLGQYYMAVESYWLECLWNGWYVVSNENGDLLRPPKDNTAIIKEASIFRREVLSLEGTNHAIRLWKNSLTEDIKKNLCARIPEIIIKGSGKKRKFEIRPVAYDENVPPLTLIYRLLAQSEYYGPLLDLPLPLLDSVTLNKLFDAWEVIRALAEALLGTLPISSDVFLVEKLLKYAPTVYMDQVADLLCTWLSISSADSKKIIRFLLYDPRPSCELWSKPFIKLGNESLALMMSPVLHGNLSRTIELWMKEGGLDLGERGYLFEEYARAGLADAIDESKILTDAGVYPRSLSVKCDWGSEEIDIVAWVKNVIIIIEAKCRLFPSEPLEFYNYFETVRQATAQIRRKAKAALSDKRKVLQQLGLDQKLNDDEVQFLPVVLMNQPLGVGFPIDGIPVTDLLILERYLADGKWEQMVTFNEKMQAQAESIHYFYKTEAEAGLNLKDYLLDPPQIRHYWQSIKPGFYPFLKLDSEDRGFYAATLEVELPIPKIDFQFGAG